MNKPATGEVITCEQLREDLDCVRKKIAIVYLNYLPQYLEHGSLSVDGFDIFPAGSGVGCIVYSKDTTHSVWIDYYADTLGFVAKEYGYKNKTPYVVREVELRMSYDSYNAVLEFVSASSQNEVYEVTYESLFDISTQDVGFIEEYLPVLVSILDNCSKSDLQDSK